MRFKFQTNFEALILYQLFLYISYQKFEKTVKKSLNYEIFDNIIFDRFGKFDIKAGRK